VLAVADGIFARTGFTQLLRWAHILAGITWIGLLYFFNLVQVPAYAQFEADPHKEIGGKARLIAIDKVTRRTLWWFRWAAVTTFLFGIFITMAEPNFYKPDGGVNFGRTANGITISLGMLLGIIMMLNVWGVIWRNQKVVLANAANVLAGGEANPGAAAAGRKAVMASRQNFIFSLAMLFCMVAASHDVYQGGSDGVNISSGKVAVFWAVAIVLVVVMELNALGLMPWKAEANKGLNAIYDGKGVRNPLIASGVFFVIVVALCEIFLRI